MKKINLLVIIMLICVVLVSCNQQKDETNSNTNNDIKTPPITVNFDSFDNLNEFLIAVNGTEDEYKKFVQENNIDSIITQEQAKSIVSNIESTEIPIASEKDYDKYMAEYRLGQNTLEIMYVVDELNYRFIYFYGQKTYEDIKDQNVVLEKKLDDQTIKLCKGDGRFFGCIEDDFSKVYIYIIINTSNAEEVSFDIFNWGSIGDN